ncbi:MAG TPA: HEPN domain-containing protein [Longimicrobium sp.]
MISTAELASTARARLIDAELLSAAGRYDSAVYLCGYAVELQLKAAICRTLGWSEFPSSNREFEKLRAVKTHDFETLLNLTENRAEILTVYQNEWEEVKTWNPELRYSPVGSMDERKARSLLGAATTLFRVL